MRYFYDLEFNDPGHGDIELISIGMVSEDGRELYVVNQACDLDNVESNEWLRENVLPHLPVRVGEPQNGVGMRFLEWDWSDNQVVQSLDVIAGMVKEFMSVRTLNEQGVGVQVTREDNELWAYYGAYDHVVMCRSLWGRMDQLPANVPMFTHELMQIWEDAGKPDMKQIRRGEGIEHHALADARWNKELYSLCVRR